MKVLIVDDHELAREGLKIYVRTLAERVEVVEGQSLHEALAYLKDRPREDHPDLILLDLLMPGMDGLRGLDAVRELNADVPLVVVSAVDDETKVASALRHDIQGYIPKGMTGSRLIDALRQVLAGEVYRPPQSEMRSSVNDVQGGMTAGDRSGEVGRLTPREKQVLNLLVHGLSNKAIARQLDLREVTIKAHLGGVFRKLDVANRTQAVRVALDNGWFDSAAISDKR